MLLAQLGCYLQQLVGVHPHLGVEDCLHPAQFAVVDQLPAVVVAF